MANATGQLHATQNNGHNWFMKRSWQATDFYEDAPIAKRQKVNLFVSLPQHVIAYIFSFVLKIKILSEQQQQHVFIAHAPQYSSLTRTCKLFNEILHTHPTCWSNLNICFHKMLPPFLLDIAAKLQCFSYQLSDIQHFSNFNQITIIFAQAPHGHAPAAAAAAAHVVSKNFVQDQLLNDSKPLHSNEEVFNDDNLLLVNAIIKLIESRRLVSFSLHNATYCSNLARALVQFLSTSLRHLDCRFENSATLQSLVNQLPKLNSIAIYQETNQVKLLNNGSCHNLSMSLKKLQVQSSIPDALLHEVFSFKNLKSLQIESCSNESLLVELVQHLPLLRHFECCFKTCTYIVKLLQALPQQLRKLSINFTCSFNNVELVEALEAKLRDGIMRLLPCLTSFCCKDFLQLTMEVRALIASRLTLDTFKCQFEYLPDNYITIGKPLAKICANKLHSLHLEGFACDTQSEPSELQVIETCITQMKDHLRVLKLVKIERFPFPMLHHLHQLRYLTVDTYDSGLLDDCVTVDELAAITSNMKHLKYLNISGAVLLNGNFLQLFEKSSLQVFIYEHASQYNHSIHFKIQDLAHLLLQTCKSLRIVKMYSNEEMAKLITMGACEFKIEEFNSCWDEVLNNYSL